MELKRDYLHQLASLWFYDENQHCRAAYRCAAVEDNLQQS